MAANSVLEIIAKHLGDLVLALASEELKDRLQELTNQELLLRLNKLFFQLDLESQLFVSRLEQLADYVGEPDRYEEQTGLSRRGPCLPVFDELVQQVRESIDDIGRTLNRIARTTKRFAPILDVYDNDLLARVWVATEARGRAIERAGKVLTDMAQDRSMALLLDAHNPVSPATLADLEQSYIDAHTALHLVHQVREGIQALVRRSYPSIKDLPQ
jgi:hypothetical protein